MRAYLLREDFQQLWDYATPTWAGKFLDESCRQVMRLPIEPMKKVARSLCGRRELLLNYCRARNALSSGIIEASTTDDKIAQGLHYSLHGGPTEIGDSLVS